jgi:hypothetical protein
MTLRDHDRGRVSNALSLLEQARQELLKIGAPLEPIAKRIEAVYIDLTRHELTERTGPADTFAASPAELAELMSPATLASLIFDIQAKSMGAGGTERDLERRAMEALVAIVGRPEAGRLIDAAAIAAADTARRADQAELERRRTAGSR